MSVIENENKQNINDFSDQQKFTPNWNYLVVSTHLKTYRSNYIISSCKHLKTIHSHRNESQRGSDPFICKTFLNLSPRAFALSEARQAPLFVAEKKKTDKTQQSQQRDERDKLAGSRLFP